jgi:hypothetical protein
MQEFCRAVLDDPLLSVAASYNTPAWGELEDDFAVSIIALHVAGIIYWGQAEYTVGPGGF